MLIKTNSDKPIFVQISNGIKDAILAGVFKEETQIPSITEFSITYKINPATALKGINILVDEGIVYKKRGLGMFVNTGAYTQLQARRKDSFYTDYIVNTVTEAKRLSITKDEVKGMVEKGYAQ